MDININYYNLLNINHLSTDNEIKKSYYKLSFSLHPDRNKDVDINKFQQISEAYSILSDKDLRSEYDKKSKFGKDYDEVQEFFNINIEFDFNKENSKYEQFKKNEILNIRIDIDAEIFDNSIEYQRFVICKSCNGTGNDTKSKLVIKDKDGNIKAMFDADDGCDFCEGTGKDFRGNDCNFCFGQGKIGIQICKTCNGEKRVLGNQKLTNIKIDKSLYENIVPHMGNFSKTEPGKVGNLILVNPLMKKNQGKQKD